MNEILNPYIAGAPVVETSMFFGREDVFNWIEHSLAGKFVGHILVLHGQRRVGKTSVLKQISNHLPERYIQVFFDFQGRTNTSLERFLWWMAREITRTLKQERDINLPRPEWEHFNTDPEYLINEFLPELRTVLGDHVLLLTFDEFDSIDRADIQETFSKPLIAYLRRLMEMEGLNFIFSIGSSGDKLENMQASYTDFFKSALYRKISFLTRDDCLQLITRPVEGVINYDRKAVERIVEITSGHPYFTQLMCHELFSLCQKTGGREISSAQVDSVLGDVIERGTVNLKFVWDEASNLEKWILAGLAHLDAGAGTQKLAQLLQQQHLRFSDPDLNSAIIHLRDKDVLTRENHFVIHLMRLWLQANRSLDRVREELVEANPIANRYIEIGDEYRETGKSAQAIESYLQALQADPGNLKAQASIGAVHLAGKNYIEAVSAFELALRIAEEDLASRSGYCDANLALGNQARTAGQIDSAIGYYQKILVINPAHTDARQHLADIYTARAEELLAARQDNAAVSAFNQAMEFTPEDDRLAARIEQVLAQKKARLVTEWLGKADRSAARQRWDEAAGFVEEALKLDPQDPVLQAKVAEVKDAPRQFKLEGCKREAEQAIKRGNFEKAIAAIETALQLDPADQSLVDWLSSVRSNQLNARLNLYRQQARKAIVAGDWDAAIASGREALKLAPHDPALQKELADTEKEKLQARLANLQSQADQAIQVGEWDAALRAIREAAQIAPDKTPWDEKLAAVETARHKARLETCRKEAQAARAAGDWDAAILALQRSLELDPAQENLQAEIETLRVEKHRSQLAGFKAQAEQAARAEKWDEAVKSWEAVLSLDPGSQTEVEAPLQVARKYARISGDYTEAQLAIRRKRFGRAIELLQGIIAQEPTYKSTSRLLVEAVEANKAIPVWRRPVVFWASGAVAVILLGVFLGPRLWTTISVALARTPVAAVTQRPSPTLPADLVSFQPILTFIESAKPTFEDDFSKINGSWGNQIAEGTAIVDMIKDGVLNLVLQAGTSNEKIVLYSPNIQAEYFVLEFDLYVEESSGGTSVNIGFPSVGDGSGTACDVSLYLDDQTWVIRLTNDTIVSKGKFGTSMKGQWVHLQAVFYGTRVVAFLDGGLLGQVEGISKYGNEIYMAAQTGGQARVQLDNVKFWNLDGVELVMSPTPSLVVTASPQSLDSIQAYITGTAPDFVDDFSTNNGSWGDQLAEGVPIADKIKDGVLDLALESGTPTEKIVLASSSMQAANFVLEVDFYYEDSTVGSKTSVNMGFPSSGDGSGTNCDVWINLEDPYWVINLSDQSINESGKISTTLKGQWNRLRVVYSNSRVVAFLNGALLGGVEGIAKSADPIWIVSTIINGQANIQLDNVKFWNLDGVQIGAGPTPLPTQAVAGPAFYEPIQSYLAFAKPTFEDDFSVQNAAWGGTSRGMAIYAMVNEGRLLLNTDNAKAQQPGEAPYLTFPINGLFDAGNFALQFDFEFNGLNSVGVEFRSASAQQPDYRMIFYPGNTWELTNNNGSTVISDGVYNLEPPYTVLLITQDQNLAIFLNDYLLYEADNLALSGTNNRIYAEAPQAPRGIFDNFKFWNLDGVQIGTGPTPLPTQAAAGPAFYEPILAYLAEGHITFQDDMTIPGNCIYSGNTCLYDNGSIWAPTNFGSIWLENGYRLVAKRDSAVEMTFPQVGEFNATDFAMQWDLSFDTSTPLDGFGLYFRASSTRDTYYQILFNFMNGGWTLSRDDGTINELGSGSSAFVPRDFNTFLVIARQENLAIFVNKELIIERNDLAKSGIYNLMVATARDGNRSARLDNVVFWNLNGVDFK